LILFDVFIERIVVTINRISLVKSKFKKFGLAMVVFLKLLGSAGG